MVLSNRTQTVVAGGKRDLNFHRPLGQNVIYVTGQMPLGDTNYTDEVTMTNPAGLFVTVFQGSPCPPWHQSETARRAR